MNKTKKTKKANKKECNSLNIGKLMRAYSNNKISKDAVNSMIGWVDTFVEHAMAHIDERVLKDRRLTVLERDVDQHINHIKAYLFPQEDG